MKTNRILAGFLPSAGLLSAALAFAASDVEDRLHESFQVKAGGKLVIEADRGSIEVKSAEAEQVAIEVFRKVGRESEAKAQEILKNHEIKFSRDGDTVRVRAEFRKDWKSVGKDQGRNLQVRYEVSVRRGPQDGGRQHQGC